MTRDNIQQIIFNALEMSNHARDEHEKIPIGPETALYGKDGHLDSMGLVGFLIDVEESLQDEGIRISLSDERAMSQKNSPFRDVPTLVDYISQIIGDRA
jgi:acyl carrier protein